jgi:hypothetical protein
VNSNFDGFVIRTGPIPLVFTEFRKIRPVFVTRISTGWPYVCLGRNVSPRKAATGPTNEDGRKSALVIFSPPVARFTAGLSNTDGLHLILAVPAARLKIGNQTHWKLLPFFPWPWGLVCRYYYFWERLVCRYCPRKKNCLDCVKQVLLSHLLTRLAMALSFLSFVEFGKNGSNSLTHSGQGSN